MDLQRKVNFDLDLNKPSVVALGEIIDISIILVMSSNVLDKMRCDLVGAHPIPGIRCQRWLVGATW